MFNCGKWSLNSSLLCNNCLTYCLFLIKIFHVLTCKPAAWVSPKESSGRTFVYWLLKFELVCSCIPKILLCWKSGVMRQYQQFSSKLVYKGKSCLKAILKISRCFRYHCVSLFESFQKEKTSGMVVTIQHCIVLNTFNKRSTKITLDHIQSASNFSIHTF